MTPFRVGTRGSALAKAQTAWVIDRLRERASDVCFETVEIVTSGDKNDSLTLAAQGGLPAAPPGTLLSAAQAGKGLFIKELEEALLAGRVDLAVHSAKDLPVEIPASLSIACVPEREDPADLLISKRAVVGIESLAPGMRVGTSSLRRRAQLSVLAREVEVVPLRGNVDTRLAKLARGEVDAVVLAAAGIARLGAGVKMEGFSRVRLPVEEFLPAPGQGALALEIREDDARARELVRKIEDPRARAELEIERGFLKRMGGDCRTPLGALAHVHGEHVRFSAAVWSADGQRAARGHAQGDTAAVVAQVCDQLAAQGGMEIVRESQSQA